MIFDSYVSDFKHWLVCAFLDFSLISVGIRNCFTCPEAMLRNCECECVLAVFVSAAVMQCPSLSTVIAAVTFIACAAAYLVQTFILIIVAVSSTVRNKLHISTFRFCKTIWTGCKVLVRIGSQLLYSPSMAVLLCPFSFVKPAATATLVFWLENVFIISVLD